MSSTSTTTATSTEMSNEPSVKKTRAAMKAFRESKPAPTTPKVDGNNTSKPTKDWGPYYSPVSEPEEMKKIVAESVSMELGAAAVRILSSLLKPHKQPTLVPSLNPNYNQPYLCPNTHPRSFSKSLTLTSVSVSPPTPPSLPAASSVPAAQSSTSTA